MTLSTKVSALTGPDRAVDAVGSCARLLRNIWFCVSVFHGIVSILNDTPVTMLTATVFLVGSGIAHLFALLSAALAARGL